ncbi:MAG: sigma 54-interacting transcriptional regulator [Spirochaetota bacterium]
MMDGDRILLTFVGAHDPYNPDGTRGPVLSYLGARPARRVYFFYNTPEYLRRARETAGIIQEEGTASKFSYVQVDPESPVDYESLFRDMARRVEEVARENEDGFPRYVILTDSGTPQMQTCWVLLVSSGMFDAELVQGVPPRFAGGAYKPRTVNLRAVDFPIVLRPPREELLYEEPGQGVEPPAGGEAARDTQAPPGGAGRYWSALIGTEPCFTRAKNEALRVARYDLSVLLAGETGSGKELFARLIHEHSARRSGPFVAINCSAVSQQIAESELFGHRRGAFTGAVSDREGFFALADGGTVFLDEVGDLPPELQPKLLRVLEAGTYSPVGESRELKTDVRVIAATNKDLEARASEGAFRLDLLTRLREYSLAVPPLRERRNDTPLLIRHFLDEWNRRYAEGKRLHPDVHSFLLCYDWPGNVRELRNTVFRMCAASPADEITPFYLPPNLKEFFRGSKGQAGSGGGASAPGSSGVDLKRLLLETEKAYYLKALETAEGNRARAARLLGIEPAAFRKALRERFGGG